MPVPAFPTLKSPNQDLRELVDFAKVHLEWTLVDISHKLYIATTFRKMPSGKKQEVPVTITRWLHNSGKQGKTPVHPAFVLLLFFQICKTLDEDSKD